jgi:DNA repair exonuclease SbcCD ATPase subunit
MLVSQIILKGFGKFEEFRADFSPGLNVIKGPNEAGKSTLAEAVTAALFVDPASGKEFLANAVKWGQNRAPLLEASLDVEGASYKLIKDFEKGLAAITPENIGMPGGETVDVNSWLSDRLGITSGEVFKSTACVSQGEISHIGDSIEAIKDKLESLATRGKEEQAASSTIKKIKDRMAYIKGEFDDNSPLRTARKGLDYDIDKLKRDIISLRQKRTDLIQVETAYANVRDDLQTRKRSLEQGEKAREIADRSSELSTKIGELKKRVDSAKEYNEKVGKMKNERSGLKLISRDELDDIGQIESGLNHLKPKHAELEEEVKEAQEELQAYKVGRIYSYMALLGFLGGGFLAACHFGGYFPEIMVYVMPYLWYSMGGSGILFFLGISSVLTRRQHKVYLSRKHGKLAGKLETLAEEIGERESRLNKCLKNHLVSSVEELKKARWRYEELDKQIETELAQYNEILSGTALGDLEKSHEEAENELAGFSEKKENLQQYLADSADLERQKLVINEIEERKKDLEREKLVLSQQIETAEGGTELLASYMERREKLQSKCNSLEHESQILELTMNCLEEARQNALVSKLEILNNRTSSILDGLTASRYSKVRFDKSNLRFEVWSDEKGGWLDPEKSLSSGTIDQIYLAARLALADLISEEKNSILILDDPFGNYDENRLENAMRVLKHLSENHQIFLLTSQDHYDKWADSTLAL